MTSQSSDHPQPVTKASPLLPAAVPASQQAPGEASAEQLVALVQACGDQRAFNQLFSRYHGKLRAFLLCRSAESRLDVEDLLQETYLKAFLHIQQFDRRAQFSTWLLRIAINEMLQSRRAASGLRRFVDRWLRGADDEAAEPVQQMRYDEQLDAEYLLARLSDIQQQVFVYSEFYGYSHSEIADKLQLPLGSVKTYMKQARDALERSQT